MTRTLALGLAAMLALACRSREPEPTPVDAHERQPSADQPEPEHYLIRHACRGFEQAIAEGTPQNRLLSTSAKHAIALGGPAVEKATQRWALLPPQALLELIERYEREAEPDPQQCAGLRAHLERMAVRTATH